MRRAHADKAGMRWLVADACDARAALPDAGAFDLAVDKVSCGDAAGAVSHSLANDLA